MFKWYQTAAACIVFLQDVQGAQQDIQQNAQNSDNLENPDNEYLHFRESKWFTRGWTLQELLAPQQNLLFYDSQWQFIGDMKKDAQLCDIVSEITSIPVAFLTGAPLSEACVAKRMSWASRRKTTRLEDIAYSLLGIFGVSMALLYGEGSRAFVRLQEEIINQTHDHSILAWGKLLGNHESARDHIYDPDYWKNIGALAASPADFKDCWDFERASEFLSYNDNLDFQITTAGIQLGANISTCVSSPFIRMSDELYLCELSCFSWRDSRYCLCIIVKKGPLIERRTQYTSTILPQYARAARILTTSLYFPAGWRIGQTIKLAKSAIHNTVRSIEGQIQDAGVILLDLPKGIGLETSHISPDFDFEVRPDKHKLGQNSFRIVYSNNTDNTCPYMPLLVRGAIAVLSSVPIATVLFLRLFVSGVPVILGVFLALLILAVISVPVLFYPELWVLVWRLLHADIGRSTINRDNVRVCLRITEDSRRTPANDDKALMLIICFWPRWIIFANPGRDSTRVLRKATLECFLSPVLTGGDVEFNHPTGLNSRASVYREWHTSRGYKLCMRHYHKFSSARHHSKNPSLYINLVKRRISQTEIQTNRPN
ncbi:hypothetical protein F4679DRAFT_553136 [Xylaria curta]|nr:hypothetical protein F4679DRAFT_553136 [Xylaria curta]